MSDLRKPDWTILLRKTGKKSQKVELFKCNKWFWRDDSSWGVGRFRIRVNGKWWPKNEMKFFTKTKIKELIFKNIT